MSNIYEDFDQHLNKHLEPKPKDKNCTNCRHYDHAGHFKGYRYCNNRDENIPEHPLKHSCDSYEDLTCGEDCKFYDKDSGICQYDGQKRDPDTICPFDIHALLSM